nr:hypothetical transcript [Hymenolepis microstoma]
MFLISGVYWIVMGISFMVNPTTHLPTNFVAGAVIMISGISICSIATMGLILKCDERMMYLVFINLLTIFIIRELMVHNETCIQVLPFGLIIIAFTIAKILGLVWISILIYPSVDD